MSVSDSALKRRRIVGWPAAYLAVWTGQQLSLIGSAIASFALVWWVTDTSGSASVLATATIAAMVPGSLLGPFVGAFVDRHDRRLIMIFADSIVALLAAWLGYLFWADALQVWHVYVILVLRSASEVFHWPAMSASTPMLVPQEHLVRVAGMNETMQGARRIASPALGALMLSLLPLHWIMGIDVITAAVAVSMLALAVIPNPPRQPTALRGPAMLWHDTVAGLRFVARWKGMLVLLVLALVANFFGTPMYSLLPLLIRNVFGGGAEQFGVAESVLGVGYLLGGLLLSLWGGFKRRIWTTLLGMIGLALSPVVAGLAPSSAFWLLLIGWGICGLAQPLANAPIMAIFQARVPHDMQGRVFMLMTSISSAMSPLGLAIAGPVADAIGLRFWYILTGMVTVAIVIVGLSVPEFMHIEELAPPPVADVA